MTTLPLAKKKQQEEPFTGSVATSPTTGFTPSSPGTGVNAPTIKTGTPSSQDSTDVAQVIRDAETGKISGIELPGGRVIMAKGSEIQKIASRNAPEPTPAGTVEASQVARANQQQELINQIGKSVSLGPSGNTKLGDNALTSAELGIGAALIGSELGAATALAPATGGLSLAAAISAAGGKLLFDARQGVKEDFNDFGNSRKNLKSIMNAVNAGTMDASEAVGLYNIELAKISRARADLKLKSQNKLENYLGGPGDELADVESFFSVEKQVFDTQLALAVANPDPRKIIPLEQVQNE